MSIWSVCVTAPESVFTVPSVIVVRGRLRDCPRDFSPAFSLKTKWQQVKAVTRQFNIENLLEELQKSLRIKLIQSNQSEMVSYFHENLNKRIGAVAQTAYTDVYKCLRRRLVKKGREFKWTPHRFFRPKV